MASPTPGPWRVGTSGDTHVIESKTGNWVCDCETHSVKDAQANARLIAAAPELLEACKELAELFAPDAFDGIGDSSGAIAIRLARAAILKAEGRQ